MAMLSHLQMPIFLGVCLLLPRASQAQPPRVPETRLGVDFVQLQDGKRLYGFLLEETDASLRFAVEAKWLEETYAEIALVEQQKQLERSRTANEDLLERTRRWSDSRSTEAPLIAFLNDEIARIAAAPAEPQPTQFLEMVIDRSDVRKVFRQPADRRHVAGIAYMHAIEDVPTTPTVLLQKSLEQMGIDPWAEQVNLADRLPRGRMQSDREWAARQALVEFQLRQPLEFQGTQEHLVRKAGQVNLADLMTVLSSGNGLSAIAQLGAELGLPEFAGRPEFAARTAERHDEWWKPATVDAEREGFRGLLTVRLDQQLLSARVVVTTSFFAMEKPGQWFEVAEFQAASRADQQPAESIDRLREDPQVKSILRSLKTLGMNAEKQLNDALQHGAATAEAIQKSKSQFAFFLDRHIRALDGPAIIHQGR